MTISLDGYVTGPQDSMDDPMGIGEQQSTRAVISGRRTYEHAHRWQGDHHDGVPIFILTHDVPDEPPPGSVRYVTGVGECAAQAREAAGDGDVTVMGAGPAGSGTTAVRPPARRVHRAHPGTLPDHPPRSRSRRSASRTCATASARDGRRV